MTNKTVQDRPSILRAMRTAQKRGVNPSDSAPSQAQAFSLLAKFGRVKLARA